MGSFISLKYIVFLVLAGLIGIGFWIWRNGVKQEKQATLEQEQKDRDYQNKAA